MALISLGARVKLNAEALNMVESVGNYVRHRRAPIAFKRGDEFVLRYVPAISGESIAHGYQVILANLAQAIGLNVCDNCKQGYFLKHSRKEFLEDELKKILSSKGSDIDKSHMLEREIVRKCVVEDIGGFLYAESPPTKRTSRIAFGYILPVEDAIRSAAIEAQFHVRYSPSARREEQAIYNVEVSSAVYGLSTYLDLDGIGYTSMVKRELAVSEEERAKRMEIALKALAQLVGNIDFGAKKTRFMPSWEVVSAVATLSEPIPFQVSSPTSSRYLDSTAERASKMVEALALGSSPIQEKITIYTYPEEPSAQPENIAIRKAKTFEELMAMLIKDVAEATA